jgi:hypothetical protein
MARQEGWRAAKRCLLTEPTKSQADAASVAGSSNRQQQPSNNEPRSRKRWPRMGCSVAGRSDRWGNGTKLGWQQSGQRPDPEDGRMERRPTTVLSGVVADPGAAGWNSWVRSGDLPAGRNSVGFRRLAFGQPNMHILGTGRRHPQGRNHKTGRFHPRRPQPHSARPRITAPRITAPRITALRITMQRTAPPQAPRSRIRSGLARPLVRRGGSPRR